MDAPKVEFALNSEGREYGFDGSCVENPPSLLCFNIALEVNSHIAGINNGMIRRPYSVEIAASQSVCPASPTTGEWNRSHRFDYIEGYADVSGGVGPFSIPTTDLPSWCISVWQRPGPMVLGKRSTYRAPVAPIFPEG
jgi:hypothetical protein